METGCFSPGAWPARRDRVLTVQTAQRSNEMRLSVPKVSMVLILILAFGWWPAHCALRLAGLACKRQA